MTMRAVLPITSLACSIVFLAIWGAGVFVSSLCIVVCVLSATAAVVLWRSGGGDDEGAIRLTMPGLMWIVLVVLLLLSAIPLPGRLDMLTGPRRYKQNQEVRAAVAEAVKLEVVKPVDVHFSVTRNRAGTLRIILLAVAMLAAGVLGAFLTSRQRSTFAWFLVVLLALTAVAGFLHEWVWPKPKTLWWLWQVAHGQPLGAFINRTHHAGFVALGAPLALTIMAYSLTLRRIGLAVLAAAAYACMVFGVATSLSRGAVVALVAGSLAVIGMLAFRQPTRRFALSFIAILLIAGAAAYGVWRVPEDSVREKVMTRLETLLDPTETDSAQFRFTVWKDSLSVWKDYAVLGVGANGFRMVYPQYRTGIERKFFSHTENEAVGLLVEGGILGLLVGTVMLVTLGRSWLSALRLCKREEALFIGIGGCLAVVAAHNLLDFPLRAPVYAIVVAALVGMVVSRAASGIHISSLVDLGIDGKIASSWFAAIAIFVTLGCVAWGTRPYNLDSFDAVASADVRTAARMLVRSPTWGEAWLALGNGVLRPGRPETSSLAANCADRAVALDPNNYLLWEQAGYLRYGIGDRAGADSAFARMKELRPWKEPPDMDRKF